MTQSIKTKLPVLRSESAEDYLALKARLTRDIRPKGAIEEIYLEEAANLVWEIQRQRGFRISILHQTSGKALKSVLEQVMFQPDILKRVDNDANVQKLVQGWLANNPTAKEKVRDLLGRSDLDESAIEAEANRINLDEVRYFDEAISAASRRLEKAMRLLMDLRASGGFAQRVRETSDEILNEPPATNLIEVAAAGAEADPEQKTAA